jgi:hypothetical protein
VDASASFQVGGGRAACMENVEKARGPGRAQTETRPHRRPLLWSSSNL